MKFTRERVLSIASTGPNIDTVTVRFPEITDLHFTSNPSASDGSTVMLPTGDYNEEATFEVPLNGHGVFWLTNHITNMGPFSEIRSSLQFQSPDNHDIWMPSHKYTWRDMCGDWWTSWSCVDVGDYIFRTRNEPDHFLRARVRFKAYLSKLPGPGPFSMRTYWFYGGLPAYAD